MRHFSIRLRLTISYAAVLAASFVLFAAGIWLALQHSIRVTVDKNLQSRLEAVNLYVDQQMRGDDRSHVQQELSEDADILAFGSLLRIVSSAGTWIYRSHGTEGWNFAIPKRETLPPGGRTSTTVIHGQPVRIVTAPLTVGVVQIALPLTEFRNMQLLLAWTVLLGSPLLLLIASLGGYWLSGQALRPVDELATTARNISAHNLTDRLPSRGTGDELDRLSDTLNGMLARLNSAFARITRFTADASHELRTPVAILRTTAEVTRAKSRSPEEHEKAWNVILTQADRMAQLIDDLLMLARADSETVAPPRELMDAAAVLRETCQVMQVIADASGLCFHVRAPQECTMFADPEDLRRILLILLDNAIKYTPAPGQIFVDLDLENAAGSSLAVISVRDTGVGILPADLPRIFDRFYRVATDRSRRTGGAGLGLPIARHLAERHSGYIQVQSAPGCGSTFSVSLPLD